MLVTKAEFKELLKNPKLVRYEAINGVGSRSGEGGVLKGKLGKEYVYVK